MTLRTLLAKSGRTRSGLLITRETVAGDTPAFSATVLIFMVSFFRKLSEISNGFLLKNVFLKIGIENHVFMNYGAVLSHTA
jgi:hypothetical protein